LKEAKSFKVCYLDTPINILYLNLNSKLKLFGTGLGFTKKHFLSYIIFRKYLQRICDVSNRCSSETVNVSK
jgi:hypothetical protein